jgi:[ribosomal protein S5]-alanine N-acetyltransferase
VVDASVSGRRLVGPGGYVGPPVDATVEIGYEIAPAFRGRGLATAAAQALIDKAGEQVATVLAHTAAAENASTGVLRRLGFRLIREVPDDELGITWRWELTTSRRHPGSGVT